jgi:hypothetical protein
VGGTGKGEGRGTFSDECGEEEEEMMVVVKVVGELGSEKGSKHNTRAGPG